MFSGSGSNDLTCALRPRWRRRGVYKQRFNAQHREIAQMVRAPISEIGCCGFDSRSSLQPVTLAYGYGESQGGSSPPFDVAVPRANPGHRAQDVRSRAWMCRWQRPRRPSGRAAQMAGASQRVMYRPASNRRWFNKTRGAWHEPFAPRRFPQRGRGASPTGFRFYAKEVCMRKT